MCENVGDLDADRQRDQREGGHDDDQVLRLEIPRFGVEGACVSIIGALGESDGGDGVVAHRDHEQVGGRQFVVQAHFESPMELTPESLPFIGKAADAGAGTAAVDRLDVKLL